MLLKAGLFGREERPDGLSMEHVDWEEVFQLSQEQGVVGLVTDGIETLQGKQSCLYYAADGTAQPGHEQICSKAGAQTAKEGHQYALSERSGSSPKL